VYQLFIILLIVLSTSVNAQRTKKITVDDYQLFAKHEYYVLKKDKSIKHGSYKSAWINGNPRQEGFYSMGMKDSLWIYYNRSKALVGSRGYYKHGLKVGLWEYFDDLGKIMNQYDHSLRHLNYTTFEDTVKTHYILSSDTIANKDTLLEVTLQRAPIYLEGEKTKFRIIQDNITYPKNAINNNYFGTVKIAFYITLDGRAIQHKVIQSVGGGCDEEALRVVKLIPDEWAPAVYDNKLVVARVIIPITFQLN
jgi:Gram-negative bacterial TonB protein C-terminal